MNMNVMVSIQGMGGMDNMSSSGGGGGHSMMGGMSDMGGTHSAPGSVNKKGGKNGRDASSLLQRTFIHCHELIYGNKGR